MRLLTRSTALGLVAVMCLGAGGFATPCDDYGGHVDPFSAFELGNPRDIEWKDSWALALCIGSLSEQTYVLQSLNMSDPLVPFVADEITLPGCCSPLGRLAVSESHAYISNQDTIYVIDISDPTSLSLVGSVANSLGAKFRSLAVREPYVFATDHWFFRTVDVSNPEAPTLVGEVPLNAAGEDIELDGDLAFVAAHSYVGYGPGYGYYGSLQAVDIATPESPAVLDSVYVGRGRPSDVEVVGDFAYVARIAVTVVDVSSLPSSGVVSEIEATGLSAYSLDSWGDFLYVGSSPFGGLDVLNITDPLVPSVVGRADFGYRTFDVMAEERGVLLASTPSSGSPSELMYWPLQCDAGALSSPATASPATHAMAAEPNPFQSETRIRFAQEIKTPASVRVFDVTGRVIRTLKVSAGASSVGWDALDDFGRSIADGVYFLRLDHDGVSRTAKVVRAR